jgi:anti-sigma factor RsiW
MIVCAHAQRLIPLLYDGELDGPLRREVSDHLINCTACTRTMALLDRSQELLRYAVDEQVDDIDFSGFWSGVESQLAEIRPAWSARLQLWWESWRPLWSWRAPVWAAASVVLFIGGATLSRQIPSPPPPQESIVLADNAQAQIESLMASDTVSVWNEPTSNATVIWVSDEGDGGLP